MAQPKRYPVVRGTGGLRKFRFAPANWQTGSSGGVRVCYVYFEEYGIVLLVIAYSKHERANLSAEECAGIKKYIEIAKKELDRRKTIR